ncbi:hypothetical protein J3Q64DRAFT_1733486 [Phycomyces blakesleeanus]|uniref:Uncharacterized protein n=1 Tax=Phycomyces blakesleeanus TaxID=4837 RepID=A0ABR3B4A5_PHYBL
MLAPFSFESTQSLRPQSTTTTTTSNTNTSTTSKKSKSNKLSKNDTIAALDSLHDLVERLTARVHDLEHALERRDPNWLQPCEQHGLDTSSTFHPTIVDPWSSRVPSAYRSLTEHLEDRQLSTYSLPSLIQSSSSCSTKHDPLDSVYAQWSTLTQCLPQMEPDSQRHVRAVALYAMRDILESKRVACVYSLDPATETVRKRADGWLPPTTSSTSTSASTSTPPPPPPPPPPFSTSLSTSVSRPALSSLSGPFYDRPSLNLSPSLPLLHQTKHKKPKRWFRRSKKGDQSPDQGSISCSWEGFDKKFTAWLDARDQRRPSHPVL